MLILDSNTISYYFRGDPQVVPRLQALRPAEVGVPAIVEYELRYAAALAGRCRSPSFNGIGAIVAALATIAVRL